MIEKSRLEELKKEKAFIFYLLNNSISIIRLDDNYDISADEYNKINNGKPTLYHNRNGIFQDICEMDKVFETKEQAEWALKYQRIPRTEYLDLPTWEEFCKLEYKVRFISNDYYEKQLYLWQKDTGDKVILIHDDDLLDFIFEEPATEENYIKACDLCVKLFKGEKK